MDIAGGSALADAARPSRPISFQADILSRKRRWCQQEVGPLSREGALDVDVLRLNVFVRSWGAVERLLRRLLDKPAAAAVSSLPASATNGSAKIEGSSVGGCDLPNKPSTELPHPSAGDPLTGLLLRAGNPRRSRTFRNIGDNGRGYR